MIQMAATKHLSSDHESGGRLFVSKMCVSMDKNFWKVEKFAQG